MIERWDLRPLRLSTLLPCIGLLLASPASGQSQRGAGGAVPDLAALTAHPIALAGPGKALALPSEVDLTRFLPVAGDQMGQSSCTGWALGYGWCTFTANRRAQDTLMGGAPMDPSRVFSPAFLYDLARDTTKDCYSPVMLAHAIDVLRAHGCCTWLELPYDTSDTGCQVHVPARAMALARGLSVGQATRLLQYSTADLRARLAQGDPIIINALIDTSFANAGAAAGGRVPFTWRPVTRNNRIGHAMLCVGYRDADSTFLVINSWGASWGDRGYLRIPYDIARSYVTDAYWIDASPLADSIALAQPGEHPSGADHVLTRGLFHSTEREHGDLSFHVVHAEGGDPIAHLAFRDADTDRHLSVIGFEEGDEYVLYHEGHGYSVRLTRIRTSRNKRDARVRYRVRAMSIGEDPVVNRLADRIEEMTGSAPRPPLDRPGGPQR